MKRKNVFGHSICCKEKCSAYCKIEGLEAYCDVRLDYLGRIKPLKFTSGRIAPQYGMVCKLPTSIELKYVDGDNDK